MKPATVVGLAITGITLIIACTLGLKTIEWKVVQGDEAYVIQDWKRGVLMDKILVSGTHFYNGWFWDTYKYKIGTQKITFDDNAANQDAEFPRIIVDVGENGGQKVYVAISVNYKVGWSLNDKGTWVFSPEKLISLHKNGLGKDYENLILRRTIEDVVKSVARPLQALKIYSGVGAEEFSNEIDKQLKNHPMFRENGIYVENTILYKVYLDAAYEQEIAKKVLAIQSTLRKQEETKAAEEEAKRVKAEAEAEVQMRTQKAEAAKQERIKAAEAEAQEQILSANAAKEARIAQAEGQKEADQLDAIGKLALGEAQAKVDMLKRDAQYAGESGARKAQVEIARSQAETVRGIFEGVTMVPEKAIVNVGGKALGLNLENQSQ